MGLKFRASNAQVTCSLGLRTCKAHSPGTIGALGATVLQKETWVSGRRPPRILPAAWPGTDHISAAGVPTVWSAPVLKAAGRLLEPRFLIAGQDCALRGRPHLQSPPSAFPLLVAIRCCQPASWSEVFPVGSSVSGCDQFVFHPVFVSHLWLFPEEAHPLPSN